MKIIREKKTSIVKFTYPDNEEIIIVEKTITIPNFPPPKVIINGGIKTIYQGGTVICDQEFVKDAEVIEAVDNVPADFKNGKYKYNKTKKEFSINPDFKEITPE